MSRTRLQWAQWFAELGIVVFEIEANSKRPKGGHSWYLRQTTDPDQIAEWFAATPDMNFGCHWGEQYVAVDLDLKPAHNGVWEFERICAENGIENFHLELPTLMIQTPSGGYHIIFRVPHPCANRNEFPPGIDTRGAVGYTVGAGSADSRGEWEVIDPDMPIMDAPPWLVDYLTEPGQKDPNHEVPLVEWDLPENVEQAVDWLRQTQAAVQGDEGDQLTYDTCCKLRDFGISEGKAFELLNESGWNERCEPPWNGPELQQKIENSYLYGQNRPGAKAVTYEKARLTSVRPAGGYRITDAQVAELFHPRTPLELVVDNTVSSRDEDEDDSDIPVDVPDDASPLGEYEPEDQLWYDFNDFVAIERVREYIISDWLIAHGITGIIAKRGTGKSTLALDIGCHLACDLDWGNIPTMRGWCVIYICGEDDEGMILNARAWTQHYSMTPDRDRFLVARDIISLTNENMLATRLEEMLTWARGRRCLIILDTWQRATAGLKSNAQEEMEIAVRRGELVAEKLKGPMIACFHPPKDGRLTIRGSAVQEDTSSGLWNMEKVADGVLLTIQRAKGSGEGNWRKFRIEKVKVGGHDAHGKPLEGIVPIKIGGTEDEDRPDYIAREFKERRAWATAVAGCYEFPQIEQTIPAIKLNRNAVAEMITKMWVDRNADPRAMDFVIRYMGTLVDGGQTENIGPSHWAVRRKLETHFFKNKDSSPVRCEYDMELTIGYPQNSKTETFFIKNQKTDDKEKGE